MLDDGFIRELAFVTITSSSYFFSFYAIPNNVEPGLVAEGLNVDGVGTSEFQCGNTHISAGCESSS